MSTIESLGSCTVCGASAGQECVSVVSGKPMGSGVHAFGGRKRAAVPTKSTERELLAQVRDFLVNGTAVRPGSLLADEIEEFFAGSSN